MASSTLTLPVDALTALPNASRTSFSKPRSEIEPSIPPIRQYSHDQEAIEMNTLDGKSTPVSMARAPEIPAWTMSVRDEWIGITACSFSLFLAGWNDATTGPLLPTIQAHYGVNFTIVSMLFVSNCIGFMHYVAATCGKSIGYLRNTGQIRRLLLDLIFASRALGRSHSGIPQVTCGFCQCSTGHMRFFTCGKTAGLGSIVMSGAVLNIHLTDRYGFGKVILLGSILQVVAYTLLAPALPFPVMCIAYAISGFGISLQDAQSNGFVAELPKNTSAKMGLVHAAYGAGAFASPLVATQFAQLPRWSFHYLTSLGLAFTNALTLFFTFRLRRQESIMGTRPHHGSSAGRVDDQQNKYKEIFSSPSVQLIAFFIWLYVGAEVTIGGWIVTFVVEERGGGPSAGYISSGFFGGIMLGRVVLLWVNEMIGERRVVYIYCILAIGLELIIWLVPNLIGNAITVALVGLLLGPVYVIAINVTVAIVPRRILIGSVGWIASFGQAGSAVFPFMTGALAQKYGVKVLQPMVVGMLSVLLVLWTLVPRGPKRRGD